MSIEKIRALQRADDEYSLLNQRRAIASTPGGLSRKMYKKIDRPTEETIQQYNQAHQRQPELVGVIDENGDPVVDDEGNQIMKRYLFHPVEAKPDLDDPLEGIDALTPDEEDYVRNGYQIKSDLLVEYERIDKELKTLLKLLKETENRRGTVADELVLEGIITNITNARDDKILELQTIQGLIDGVNQVKYDIEQKDLHNKAIIEGNRQNNAIKLKAYQEQLNLLNSGKFNMTQEPYESDEDYKQRLISHSQIEAPSEALYDAKVYASKEIRNKLKEIIKNDVVIDLIANSLTNEQKYNIMREWGSYAKAYKEIYGDYNPTQTVTDLVAFFTNPLSNATFNALKSRGKIETTGVKKAEVPLLSPIQTDNFVADVEDNLIIITRLNKEGASPFKTDEVVYIKVVKKSNKKGKSDLLLILFSKTGLENSFVNLESDPIYDLLQDTYGWPDYFVNEFRMDMLELTAFKSDTPNATKLINKFKVVAVDTAKVLTKKPETYGWGVKQKEIPQYSPFGNITINTRKLYYDNVLSIRDKNGYQMHGMTPVKVSNDFTKLIFDILENKNITIDDLDLIKPSERLLYDHLIVAGKLHKEKPNKADETGEKLKRQFEILEGEYNAGNNNPNIKKQIKTILYKLYHFGKINMVEVKDYLKQL